MSCRGIKQLKSLNVVFCDHGGSSKGVRDFMKTDEFYNFVNENQDLKIKFLLRRGSHPYIQSEYINGFNYTSSLRSLETDAILESLKNENEKFGRKAYTHAGHKVISMIKSVQGGWRPNLLNKEPKNELLNFKYVPEFIIDQDKLGIRRKRVKKFLKDSTQASFRKSNTIFNKI